METNKNMNISFQKKVWIVAAIVSLFIVVLWILKAIFSVLLLVLAGILIALYFHGLSSLLNRKLGIPNKVSLVIATVGSILLLILFLWFTGDRIQQQVQQLSDSLPSAVDDLKQKVNAHPIGQKIMNRVSSGDGFSKSSAVLQSFFRTTFGVLGDIYVVLFLGLFFTASPKIYKKGFIKLIPKNSQAKGEEVIDKIGSTLTKWLKGMIFSMLVVFALTAIGLAILGVPMWLVLALIAGLLSFVPNFGPLLALIPAVLIGFMEGPTMALLILGLYMLIQLLESNLIMPQIQKKLIHIPPALMIIAQLVMGVLIGGWGLVLATALTAIVMVVLQEVYIKKQEVQTSSEKSQ